MPTASRHLQGGLPGLHKTTMLGGMAAYDAALLCADGQQVLICTSTLQILHLPSGTVVGPVETPCLM